MTYTKDQLNRAFKLATLNNEEPIRTVVNRIVVSYLSPKVSLNKDYVAKVERKLKIKQEKSK